MTEEFDQAIAQWQSDTATKKAVLQAAVRDVTIAGYDETGTNYVTGGLVNNFPAQWNRTTGFVTGTTGSGVAIRITSPDHTLQTNDVVTIAGVLGNTNANVTNRAITKIDNNVFELQGTTGNGTYAGGGVWTCNTRWPDKYHGLLMRGSGLLVDKVNFFYIPGIGLEIKEPGTDSQNGPYLAFDRKNSRIWSCKIIRAYAGFLINQKDVCVGRLEGSHLRDYGIKFAASGAQIDGALHFYGVGSFGVEQPAVWFADGADQCSGGPIYAESSPIGTLIESDGNKLSEFHSHSCPQGNLVIKGENNLVAGGEIRVMDGTTELYGKAGVSISGKYTTLRDLKVLLPEDGGGPNVGETGIRIDANSDGGSHLVLDNINILGGQGTNRKGTGIEAKTTLNNSTIIAYVQWLGDGVGVDLLDGTTDRIGDGNTIWITYDTEAGDMTASEALQLHSNWNPSNNPAGDTNDVRINGVRYYK
jgi:hypothetical protein